MITLIRILIHLWRLVLIALRVIERAVMPHSAPGPEDDTVGTGKIKDVAYSGLYNGVTFPVLMKANARVQPSLAVGSGSGLDSLLGGDGRLLLEGNAAQLVMVETTTPNALTYGTWYVNNGIIWLQNQAGRQHLWVNNSNSAAGLLSSLRLGAGGGFGSSYDGADGLYVASGTSAGILMGDRATPSSSVYGQWFRSGNFVHLYTSDGTTLISFETTGAYHRTKASAVVGSQSAIAGWYGQDGGIFADGNTAGVWIKDRANAGWFGWYRSSDLIRLWTNLNNDIWVINATTGIISQDALTGMTANGGITILNNIAATPCGTRRNKPDGSIYCCLNIQTLGAVGAGWGAAVMSGAHAPSANVWFTVRRHDGTPVTGYVRNDGWVIFDAAAGANYQFHGTFTYYQ